MTGIIDCRFRPPYKSFLDLHMFTRDPFNPRPGQFGFEPPESLLTQSVDAVMKEMDDAGITMALVLGRRAHEPFAAASNEDLLEFTQQDPTRFFAVPTLEPADVGAALGEIERYRSHEVVKAFHVEPGWSVEPMRADGPKLYPIYQRLNELGLPLMITAGGTIGPDFSYVDPVHLHRVARDFPDLKIVLSHGGWPYVIKALAVAYDCTNVYIAPDAYMNVPNMPGSQEYVRAANYYLADRLLFGTAYPARPIGQSVNEFNALDLANDEIRQQILYSNAVRLFGLELI